MKFLKGQISAVATPIDERYGSFFRISRDLQHKHFGGMGYQSPPGHGSTGAISTAPLTLSQSDRLGSKKSDGDKNIAFACIYDC